MKSPEACRLHGGGKEHIMGSIVWEQELKRALGRGQAEHKPILVDFFSPG